ncbi:MAG: MFS transporter, partial [Spirochaetales bacterium]|nr:MFS transporter [Spirochaetales bacterium]
MKDGMKAYYGVTFLIGLGFFTMGLMDPLYDTYVPIFLSKYIESKGLIGSVMTLDNIFALFLIPIVSALSDRTRTRIGRRMPYIVVTLPLTAVFFGLVPFSAFSSLALLIITVFMLNIFKQAARGPVVALMPDTVPGDYRSEANGVINTMGGIAAIVGTVGLARLMDVKINLPGRGPTEDILPFPIAGVLVILATIALLAFIREKRLADAEQKIKTIESLKLIFAGSDRSALLILVSLFLWFLGYQGVLPFIGLYSTEVIGVSSGTAGL